MRIKINLNTIYYSLETLLISVKYNGLFKGFYYFYHLSYTKLMGLFIKNHYKFGKFTLYFENKHFLVEMFSDFYCKGHYKFSSKSTKPVIIDIGANVGDSVVYFKSIYPDSIIYSFEPLKIAYSFLIKNVHVNKLTNVKMFNCGIASQNKKSTLYFDKNDNFISASLFRGNNTNQSNRESVILRRLDTFTELNKHSHIDLLKIDAEGAETDILKSLMNLLDKTNVTIIEYHFGLSHTNNSIDSIYQILSKKKFILFFISGYKAYKNISEDKNITIYAYKNNYEN